MYRIQHIQHYLIINLLFTRFNTFCPVFVLTCDELDSTHSTQSHNRPAMDKIQHILSSLFTDLSCAGFSTFSTVYGHIMCKNQHHFLTDISCYCLTDLSCTRFNTFSTIPLLTFHVQDSTHLALFPSVLSDRTQHIHCYCFTDL